uniref:Secretion system protein E n=1 Tax=Fervidicoccus fontis TaxID=683846 RepID=A0A7J3ZIY4_9CREN
MSGDKANTTKYMRALFEEYEVVEFYKISHQAAVLIFRENRLLRYMPIEPLLVGREARVLARLKELVPRVLKSQVMFHAQDTDTMETELKRAVDVSLRYLGLKLDPPTYEKLFYYLRRDLLGLGPVDVMYRDEKVEDITCAGARSHVYVFHRDYEWLPTTVRFDDPEELLVFARRLAWKAGHDLVYANPIVEGPLPPKMYRTHLTMDVVSIRGPSFTIRKGTEEPLTLPKLIDLGTLSVELAAYLWLMVSNLQTILIAGPMASGKTSLLNAIAMLIPPQKKIVTIEETNEIRLPHENWTPMVTRESFQPGVSSITLFDLLKSSLRQRPDYIIVGEIRGEEAYTFFQAISVGHGGLGTIHSESYEQVIRRLESPPMNLPRPMLALLNSIVVLQRIRENDEFSRKVVEVVEIAGYDPARNIIRAATIASYDTAVRTWTFNEPITSIRRISQRTGVDERTVLEDLRRRATILRWMVAENIVSASEVFETVKEYHYFPERVYDRARSAGYL